MDDEELVFKRFPPEKQDQVRQLVGFATLMGLTGKDLVSIGSKLDRIKLAGEKRQREAALVDLMDRCSLIGKDRTSNIARQNPRRFNYADDMGRKWKIEHIDYYGADITSDTGVCKRVRFLERYAVSGGKYDMKQCLLNIYYGDVQLNF